MKEFRAGVVSQLKDSWKVLFFLYLPIVLLFLFVAVLSRTIENISLGYLLRDVTVTGDLPFFAGFVSQLTAMLWAACLTICLFALIMLGRGGSAPPRSRRFLLQGSILTGVLLLDDVFLFHEEIAPLYLHLNEDLVYAGYAIIGIGFVVLNWKEILSSEYAILMLALGLFGASIFLDALPLDTLNLRYFWEQLEFLLEDGCKFAGIATWLTFFVRYTIRRLPGVPQGNLNQTL
jgi:hypothetical protein